MIRKTIIGASVIDLGAALCVPAAAQTVADAPDALDNAEVDDQQEDPFDNSNVIIVTATQRASDVQDIPIAVTAVTPAQLDRQGINNIQSLGAVAPSFNVQSSQTESQGTSIRLRGIGTTGNNIGLESAVGVFIDGVYQSRPGVALGELVDVQQIEVLRGPQGTLFGRNTTAGALVIRNKALGQDVNDRDRYLLRGQLLWEPNADISLRIIGDYQETDERCCDSITLSPGANINGALFNELYPNGVIADFANANPAQNRLPVIDGRRDLRSNGQFIDNSIEQWGVSGELVWDFGGPSLTALVSYRDFRGDSIQDDFQASQVYSIAGITEDVLPPLFDDIKTFTAEARLQGNAGPLDYLVGVYYADEDIVEEASLTLGPDFQRVAGIANFGGCSAKHLPVRSSASCRKRVLT